MDNPQQLLTELVSALGPMGFIIWMVWRTTNHTIPRIAKSFEESLARQRQDFNLVIKQQRQDFREAMGREREFHETQVNRLVEAIRDLSNRPRCKNHEASE